MSCDQRRPSDVAGKLGSQHPEECYYHLCFREEMYILSSSVYYLQKSRVKKPLSIMLVERYYLSGFF